jgi:putative oxidoreductase
MEATGLLDTALLTLRSATGGLLAGHGAQKLFGAFDGPGLQGTEGMMRHLRMEPAQLWGVVDATTELVGGTLTAIGLLGPVGPIMCMGPMVMATTTAHWGRPIWVTQGGAELPVTNLAAYGALALAGPGRLSVDGLLGIRVPRWLTALTAAGVAVGCAAGLALRRPPEPQATPQPAETRAEEERELTATAQERRRPARAEAQAQPAE